VDTVGVVTETTYPSATGGHDNKIGISLIDDSMAELPTSAVSVVLTVFIKPQHRVIGLPHGATTPSVWVVEAGDMLVMRRVAMQSKSQQGGIFHNLVSHSDRRQSALIVVSARTGSILCRWPPAANLLPRERRRVVGLRAWATPRLHRAPFHQEDFRLTIQDVLMRRGGVDRRQDNFDLFGMLVGAIVGDGNSNQLVAGFPPCSAPIMPGRLLDPANPTKRNQVILLVWDGTAMA